jgi:RNA polymerase sigma-70 factor, ECF subfamily
MARDEAALVDAARAGDERAFVELTAGHRGALHAHCYRLLGSVHDADDALQETLLRAWSGLDGFEPRARLRAWLYRIATNVCLRMLERRSRAPVAAVDAHLEPYPDGRAGALALALDADPAAAVERREAIGLAFVAAMQLLAPKQRVVLVLRDVLDWSRARWPTCSRTASRRSTARCSGPASGSPARAPTAPWAAITRRLTCGPTRR